MQVRSRTSHTPHARQPQGEWLQCWEQREHFSLCARLSQTHSFLKTFLQLQSAVLTSSLEFLSLFVLTLFKAFSNSSLYLWQIRSQLIPSQNCQPVEGRISVLGGSFTSPGFLVPPHTPGLPRCLANSSVLTISRGTQPDDAPFRSWSSLRM